MKKIGIVGGIAWQSTVLYYSELCHRAEQRHFTRKLPGLPSIPEISIESVDHAKAVSYLGVDDDEASWARFDDYHRAALKRLETSGTDFAIIASNTGHHRFEAITRGIRIPVISIIDVMAKETARIGARQALLLGTALTMRSARFREEFARHGVEAAGPRDKEVRTTTVELLMDIQLGRLAGASERLEKIAKLSFGTGFRGQRVVCLACTELPLAFETMKMLATFEHDGIVFINSAVVHIDAAFNFALDDDD